MTADSILKIPEFEPEHLFPKDESEAKDKYHELMLLWHPDTNKAPEAQQVSDHLIKLYKKACEKIRLGTWALPNCLLLKGEDGKERKIKFRRKRKFEIGEMYYGNKVLAYVVRSDCADLFDNALNQIKRLKYADSDMEQQFSRYMPAILDSFKTSDGNRVLVLAKTDDVFLMRDVLEAKSPIDPRHVAWMVSSLHNILCYFNYTEICHNAISLDTCFISPKYHSVLVLGGWWYSTKHKTKIKALPSRSITYAPSDILRGKISSPKLDLTLLRITAREMLGDISGTALPSTVPKAMASFLKGCSSGNPIEDYKNWSSKTLIDSFGQRKFLEFDVDQKDIYKES